MKKTKTMLRAVSFAAALVITAGFALPMQGNKPVASTLTVHAADEDYTTGTSGVFTYKKYSDHIEISRCEISATSAEIPETIEGLPVTTIGMYAFQISKIETVTIPDTVTEIGHYSFCMCPNLKSVTIPSSVQKIGIRAFETCPNLTEVNLPDKIIEMNSCVFEGSPWLEEQRKKDPLVIVNGILIDGQTCKGDVVIPQSVKYVASSAFARNNDVTSVVFPSGVTKLCDNTFFYCSNLKSVDVKSVTILDSMAFDNCDKLTDLKISNKLKSIDYYTFADIDSTCTVTFYGKESEWQSVEKPENDPFLSRANVVFAEAPDDEVAGDVNMDGSFNISDLVLVQKWLIGNKSDEMKNWKAADFIADDKLDIYDLIKMRRELFK